jgi:adenylate cyclase
VAETVIDDPDRASLGVETEVTVLFADLGGYTAFAETATPTEVVAMLNELFGAAVPVVLAEGGAVVQFMGDAMMVIFNAPTPQPDHGAAGCPVGVGDAIGDRSPAVHRRRTPLPSWPQYRAGDRGKLAPPRSGTSWRSVIQRTSPHACRRTHRWAAW